MRDGFCVISNFIWFLFVRLILTRDQFCSVVNLIYSKKLFTLEMLRLMNRFSLVMCFVETFLKWALLSALEFFFSLFNFWTFHSFFSLQNIFFYYLFSFCAIKLWKNFRRGFSDSNYLHTGICRINQLYALAQFIIIPRWFIF